MRRRETGLEESESFLRYSFLLDAYCIDGEYYDAEKVNLHVSCAEYYPFTAEEIDHIFDDSVEDGTFSISCAKKRTSGGESHKARMLRSMSRKIGTKMN